MSIQQQLTTLCQQFEATRLNKIKADYPDAADAEKEALETNKPYDVLFVLGVEFDKEGKGDCFSFFEGFNTEIIKLIFDLMKIEPAYYDIFRYAINAYENDVITENAEHDGNTTGSN